MEQQPGGRLDSGRGDAEANRELTRISHEFSAAAPDPSARTALRLFGLLDVSVKVRLRRPLGARLALPAPPTLRDENP